MIDFEEIAERVSNDLEFRKLLQAARTWGVSPRRFLGTWEAALITVYNYDRGVLVSTEQRYASPEWTDEDRCLALALDLYESSLCDGCGHPLEETTKPEHYGAYQAKPPIRCHRCTEQLRAAEQYEDTPQSEALKFPIDLVPGLILDPEEWEYDHQS